jgi:tetratricopeptide (TPR) repeat protein
VKPKVKNTKSLSQKEREFFNKKEYNSFVDDAYLLMGKAHFIKHDYGLATETFRLMLADFKNDPILNETQIWLARTYSETRQYSSAEEILNFLAHQEDFPRKLLPDLYATWADFYLKQENFPATLEYLEKALALSLPRNDEIRFTFILAQLYEKTGDLKKATDLYGKVIRMNPPYAMAFNARINRALTYQQGFGSAGEIEKELMKMLKDDKNLDYRDQIYYALGDLAFKAGNMEKAIENYKMSVVYNTRNSDQKSRSYLTLANLYYNQPDYINAQAYYDSTVVLLDPSFKGYDLISAKSMNLTRLVTELNAFTLEDSVQRLSKMTDAELLAFIDKIIDDVRKEEERQRQLEQEKMLNEQFGREFADQGYRSQTDPAAGSKWYFYNDVTKNMGYKEFKIKWGNRKLEDHWQRQNKAMVMFASGNENGEETEQETAPEKQLSNKTREYYLRNVPRNDSMLLVSHKRCENALYNMGLIYKNDLKDYERANDSFQELLRRYPLTDYRLSVYYNLYILAREKGDQNLMIGYRNRIVNEFPESIHARIMTNPGFLKEIEEEEKKIVRYYEQTYDLFLQEKYAEVITRSTEMMKVHPEDPLSPRFDYLRVLSLGKTSEPKVFRDGLSEIIAKYPETDISEDAQNILAYMNKEHPQLLEEEEKEKAEKLYHDSAGIEHTVIFIMDKKSNNNQLLFNLINFNLDNYDKENLIIETVEINARQNLLIIRSFKDKLKSVDYLNHIGADQNVFSDYNNPSVKYVSISSENLKILLEDKAPDRYLKFYEEHFQ